jgi:Ca2+-binding RTX toxin-like protein
MARVKAFKALDMSGITTEIGDLYYFDGSVLVITTPGAETYYYGDFSYPGGAWRGTITGIDYYDSGPLHWYARGLDLPTRYATAGTAPDQAVRKALSGNDRIVGSAQEDTLLGFAGNDVISGKGGGDKLLGGAGKDRLAGTGGDDVLNGGAHGDALTGGGGADKLFGGAGKDQLAGGGGRDVLKGGDRGDVLAGGAGADTLVGGAGWDHFVFRRGDGRDVIKDFRNNVDKIVIASGASAYGDLEIERKGSDTIVAFADVEIILEDLAAGRLDAGDFIFE